MKVSGPIPWNAKPICETFKISCLMGRLHMRDVLENLSKDQSFRWKGYIMFADMAELETMDASEIYSKRLNTKEVIFPHRNGNSYFQPQMDESNSLEEIKT